MVEEVLHRCFQLGDFLNQRQMHFGRCCCCFFMLRRYRHEPPALSVCCMSGCAGLLKECGVVHIHKRLPCRVIVLQQKRILIISMSIRKSQARGIAKGVAKERTQGRFVQDGGRWQRRLSTPLLPTQ